MAELKDRDKHEARFAGKISRLSAKHRRELERLLGNPPDLNNVPSDFWQRVEDEMNEELAATILLIFVLTASQHGLARERADTLGLAASAGRARSVASTYVSNSIQSLERASREWRAIAADGRPVTASKVRETTLPVFGPQRAVKIATTETTEAQSAGSEAAVGETVGFTEDDTWFTEKDARVCPICQPLHRKKRSVWAAQFSTGPPAHVNCRCWVHYKLEKRGAAVIS